MKLYTFDMGGQPHLGAERAGELIDLTAAGVAPDLLGLIALGGAGLQAARQALEERPAAVSIKDAQLYAPLHPGKILCSGINYQSHFAENPNAKLPDEPIFFAKLPNTVIGPGAAIRHGATTQLDYEVEFAAIMGRRVPSGEAIEELGGTVFGYTLLNDVSARDVQFKDSQITLGKNFDTFAPIGPCVVTVDEVPRPNAVALKATLNGRVMQDGNTSDWLFSLPQLLSALTRLMTLNPGDLVTTGTPAGVGFFQQPQVFMQVGDTIMIEAQGIGQLINTVEP